MNGRRLALHISLAMIAYHLHPEAAIVPRDLPQFRCNLRLLQSCLHEILLQPGERYSAGVAAIPGAACLG